MAGKFKEVKAVGKYVVLEFVPVKQDLFEKKEGSSLLLPTGETEDMTGTAKKEIHKAMVHDIGPEVEKPSFKVGDEVVFNQYDMKMVENSDGQQYGVLQGTSIMAVLNI